MNYEEYRWIAKDKFHFVKKQTAKSLCGRQIKEPDYELPEGYMIPRIEHICKRCGSILYKKGRKKARRIKQIRRKLMKGASLQEENHSVNELRRIR